MANGITTKQIKLNDVLVNTENFRFEPVAGQKDAIDKMIMDQEERLINLAQHIVENGLDPSVKILVSPSNHDKSKYNVLDGNRRVTAMKLVNTPDLIDIDGQAALKKKFKKLHETYIGKMISEIECVVFENPDDANPWIRLKHTGANDGIGSSGWNSQQIDRFNEKVTGKPSMSLQIIKLLKSSPDTPTDVKDGLGDLKTTNLERLVSDPSVREFLGIEVNDGLIQSQVDKKEVMKGLIQITKDLLQPGFNVKKIYTKEDRRDYIKSFGKASVPNTQSMASKPWHAGDQGGKSQAKKKSNSGKKINPTERKNLIPKSCAMTISNPKVNLIFHELKKLDAFAYTNAVAVLLRVFVESSIDCYRDEHRLKKGASSAGEKSANLLQKVSQVADKLEASGHVDSTISRGIKKAAKDGNGILGIETLHAYVHNNKLTPIAKDLLTAWDNLESFMEAVWENIK